MALLPPDLLGLLTEPRVGLPLTLIVAGLAAWYALGTRGEPRRSSWEAAPPLSDAESVSRTYLALYRGEYSVAVREMRDRLDRRVRARTGRSMHELPWRGGAQRRLGIPDPRRLRASREVLDGLERWAYRLETGSYFRWDFWRSAESSQRALHARLGSGLLQAGQTLRRFDPAP